MELVNNKYSIQNIPVADICKQFGTPLYVYDAGVIVRQIESLKQAFSSVDVRIKYAAKALTNVNILKVMRSNGVGVDVVSIEEAKLAFHAGYSPEEIMFTPNGVAFDEIKEAVTLGVAINIDNLPTLKKFGEQYGNSKPCSLRINPGIMAGGNYKISTGHLQSKFGISSQQSDSILETVKQYNIQISGLHVHTGSEVNDVEVFLKVSDILFTLAKHFPSLKFLDFGGGFKVAYKEGDSVTDLKTLGHKLGNVFNQFCSEIGKKLELWIEPGKYLVSEAGILFATSSVVKETPALTFVHVNSGLNHLLRPMMYDAHHDIVNVSNPSGVQKIYTVVGYICETDTIGANRNLNEVREGDLLAIKNAGAYGFSMSSNYNSRLRPAEVLVENGKATLIRKAETFDDLLKDQIL
ncbi:MAG TPA: diaminopimelate decarboxylase [Cyclobacteriaceae bacterium]